MTTINVELKNAEVGDLFEGTYREAVVKGKIKRTASGFLVVVDALPSIKATAWEDVKITREVTTPVCPGIYFVTYNPESQMRDRDYPRYLLTSVGWFTIDEGGVFNRVRGTDQIANLNTQGRLRLELAL